MAEENNTNTDSSKIQPCIFSKEASLGGVVADKQLVCNLGVDQILHLESRLQFCCGFDKLGFLCGFKFTSNKPEVKNKTFYVVFVPKLKSSIMRQQARGRSSWYIWEYIDKTNVNVLSKAMALKIYGFDIDMFFNSNLFKAAVPKFMSAIRTCLDGEVAARVATLQINGKFALNVKNMKRYIHSIEDSLNTLKDSSSAASRFNLGNGSDGERKVYRATTNYTLDHFQKRQKSDELKNALQTSANPQNQEIENA